MAKQLPDVDKRGHARLRTHELLYAEAIRRAEIAHSAPEDIATSNLVAAEDLFIFGGYASRKEFVNECVKDDPDVVWCHTNDDFSVRFYVNPDSL